MSEALKVSLVATVLNEADTIRPWLDSLLAQTRPPDEIIIVDGGSTDATPDIIRQYADRLPLTLIIEPGLNISAGRNLAIQHATQPIIACTDAGTRPYPDWLHNLLQPYADDSTTVNVAGFFVPDYDPRSPFQVAMAAAVLPTVQDIRPRHFLPSSRSVAFRKAAWEAVDGYPEWLDYCEDLVFDLRLKTLTGDFHFAPEARVAFRPRTRLQDYLVQYYRYARGDGKADLWRKRHAVRYLTYLVLLPGLLLLGRLAHPAWWGGLLLGGLAYLFPMYRRLPRYWAQLSLPGKLQAIGWVAVIRAGGDIAKMIGYPVGWWWRWQHQPPDWRPTP